MVGIAFPARAKTYLMSDVVLRQQSQPTYDEDFQSDKPRLTTAHDHSQAAQLESLAVCLSCREILWDSKSYALC